MAAGLDVLDGSRRINAVVMKGLGENGIVWGERRSGKTITMLHFVASRIWSWKDSPIVICESQNMIHLLRDMWRANFAGFPDPRWMTHRQFLRSQGMRGNVFLDEPRVGWRLDEVLRQARGCAAYADGIVCGVTSI